MMVNLINYAQAQFACIIKNQNTLKTLAFIVVFLACMNNAG